MAKQTGVDIPLTRRTRDKFLKALSVYGNVSRSADIAGVSRACLYKVRQQDAAFAAEWEYALSLGIEGLEDEAKRRAVDGWEEPVWYQGQACGTVRKYSDALLLALLRAHCPDKYAERTKSEVSATVNVTTKEQRDAAVAAALLGVKHD